MKTEIKWFIYIFSLGVAFVSFIEVRITAQASSAENKFMNKEVGQLILDEVKDVKTELREIKEELRVKRKGD